MMMMMLRSCYRPIEKYFGRSSGDWLMWHADLKRHAYGEYSIAFVQANSNLEDQSRVLAYPNATYIGVFDGHGGPEASRFVNEHLLPSLHNFATEGGLSADAIKRAFSETEEALLRLVTQRPQIASVGSCCLVGAISDNVLHVANLGDSRAVLGSRRSESKKNEVVAHRLSTDHNVSVEEVRKEVESLHPDDANVVVCTSGGVWRIKGIIQVSRAIGDFYLKKPEFARYPPYLKRPVMTAEPSIVTRELRPQDLFVIFASDGLWELLSDQEAVDIVFNNPRAGIARRLMRAALQEAAKKSKMTYNDLRKIREGERRRYHDDITVVVVYFDHHERSPSSRNSKFKQKNTVRCTTMAPVDIFSLRTDEMDDFVQD